MSPTEVQKAFLERTPVLGKGDRGYIVNLTGDGRPVFATNTDTGGIGRCLNFQDISPITAASVDRSAPPAGDTHSQSAES